MYRRLKAPELLSRARYTTHDVFAKLGTAPPITALDQASIDTVRRRLQTAWQQGTPAHMRFSYSKAQEPATAAVLLALCSVNGQPSVLFEERNNRLSSHGGEVCFAGGKADPMDRSLEHTALRETWEELGLAPDRVRVVGRIPPVPNKTRRIRVHTVVGMVAGELDVSALDVNREEVHRAFTLPISHFYRMEARSATMFRGRCLIPQYQSDKPGLAIWGLTAFILHEFLCRVSAAGTSE
ncbi:hypothetical protein J3B02_001540 [Coemansia erecta]|uniref:Nudix hydrolase domain-containing protein n=1 Tax=Coemansia asiatica TaxID=1052880 RepID=A0A9W7XLG0_9FUNG|nr:hypothetical protein LPJ64_003122 [Coemansia asiatica]KAJ2856552.1 hypothetical protein J3B02_001540 [Coemansia erecta]KAJ2867329.1 hypothetical protein FB639_004949 [Coemansia asiatica]